VRRLRFVLVLLAGLAASAARAGVEGVVAGRTEWSGTVEVTADVWVPPGSELVIRSGTRVRFAEALSTKTDPLFWHPGTELAVGGRLVVEGTPDAPVVFDGEGWGGLVAAPGGRVRLRGVRIRNAQEGLLAVGARAVLEDVVVEGGEFGLVAGPGARIEAAGTRIRGAGVGVLEAGGEVVGGPAEVTADDADRLRVPAAEPEATLVPVPPARGPRVEYVGEYTVARDETWSGEVVVAGRVTVVPEAVLTLAPGTHVRFRRIDTNADGLGEGELLVLGGIRSLGTLAAPVVFESAEAEPRPGDWDKVSLVASEDPDNRFRFTVFRHGVQALHAHFSAMTVDSCLFTDNLRAVQFQESPEAEIRSSAFWRNKQALRFRDSRVRVIGSWFGENWFGVHAFRAELEFRDNRMVGQALGNFLAKEGRVVIEGCRFEAARDGARFKDPDGVVRVRGCEIRDVAQDALSFSRVQARVEGSVLEGAGLDLVGVDRARVVLQGNRFGRAGRDAIHLSGPAEVDARGNRWQGWPPERIHDGEDEPGLGRVLWRPAEEEPE